MNTVIVSRHAGGIAFIRAERPELADAPIIEGAITADDVRGMHVIGNLPLHLAALAASYTRVEFDGPPPGREFDLTADEMRAAGARLVRYTVRSASELRELSDEFRHCLSLPDGRYTEEETLQAFGTWAVNSREAIAALLGISADAM